jgi:hypothetical protein
VVDAGVALECAEAANADGPVARHPAEVVAREVGDHHVLRAVLFAAAQLGREPAVQACGLPARPCSLDRPCFDEAAAAAQEPFGRRRDHVGPAKPHQRHERAGARLAHAGVEGERIARPRRAQPLREVHLEDIAGADVVDRMPHGLLVVGP